MVGGMVLSFHANNITARFHIDPQGYCIITVLYCISNLFFQEYEKKLALLKKAVDKKAISDPSL